MNKKIRLYWIVSVVLAVITVLILLEANATWKRILEPEPTKPAPTATCMVVTLEPLTPSPTPTITIPPTPQETEPPTPNPTPTSTATPKPTKKPTPKPTTPKPIIYPSSTPTSSGELVYLGRFKLTAYCPCRKCSEGWGNKTATGVRAIEGRTIAVDPRVIPYGSAVVINGKEYVAEDCGGAIKKKRIDIYFESHSAAWKFGVQYADVYLKK
jgi:3D (Asp-Asp-Asp) domain-containing protein